MKATISFFFLFVVLLGVTSCRVQRNPPELTGLSASEAFVGDPLLLTGYQFGSSPTVTFGLATSVTTAAITSQDENTIRVTVPGIKPGPTQIRVQTDEGVSDPLPFTVKQPTPIVAAISPTNGLQGTLVVITGSFLNQIRRVRFNDVNAEIKDSTDQKLTIVVPAVLPRGPVPLVVETVGGAISSRFIVAGTPQITSISPLQAKPGAELVIKGVNLTDGLISINGLVTDKATTTVKDTEIRTIIPATATSGLVRVSVFEALLASSTDTLKIVQSPIIANLLAQDGITGDKLTITGRNFKDITAVSFGSTPATFRVISDTQLEATVPALPVSGPVTVSASSVGGNTTATDPFFFYLPPSNLVVTPAQQLRGRTLTISGKNLYRITTVTVSGIQVPVTSRNEGVDLLIGVPLNAISGQVVVSSRAGSASAPLYVLQPPVITAVLPAKARPGDQVVIQGNFLLNAQIFFTGAAAAAADGGKNEDTERWVLVPTDTQAGPIRIVNGAGETTSTTSFTAIRLVTITDFTPKSAKVGIEVFFTGQNLATVTSVKFNGGTSAPATFRVSGGTLAVTIPADAVTGQLCLTNDAGTVCTSSNFTITK
ncbi:IPT/TIG domain-containing protein [Spirosoma spitsbergense]|uniref:IPT/TIG domain-containing protein n=1 Tax=Spirosoma spitsbergense TaxID=431554 RepID=UPI000376DF93|nr:IPT/TIG domain-containing protein [Spirosoma spitsbergense]